MRREFPARVKAAALKRCMAVGGVPRCEGVVNGVDYHADRCCDAVLTAGGTFYDHKMPDGLGGEPTLENCQVLCRTCHDTKTFGEDNPRMQKADRQKKKHYGVTRKRRTIPGKKFDGTPIPSVWK